MSLNPEVEKYIAFQRLAGYKYDLQARVLRSFARYADSRGDECILVNTAMDWALLDPAINFARIKYAMLRRFGLWLRASDPRHELPPPNALGHRERWNPPTPLLEPDEINAILDAALRLRPCDSIRPQTYHHYFGLVGATGIRRSEAISLLLSDLLFDESALLIRESKFGKSRIIPIDRSVADALKRYLVLRQSLTLSHDYVFVGLNLRPLNNNTVWKTFRNLARECGIERPSGHRYPTVHSLRHTFAVRTLERSLRESRDGTVPILPALSTYLGHAHVSSTYWYLQCTPALMRAISNTAESHFLNGAPS